MEAERYDVAVIGGGPAGSRAATLIARGGYRVLLLEKRERIGYPIRCAEAVGPRADVERFLQLDQSLISSPINGFLVRTPSGETLQADMEGIGFILDRERFDRRLAEIAAEAGAEVRCAHQAMRLTDDGGTVTGFDARDLTSGREYRVEAAVVVGADGVEGLSLRWAGLDRGIQPGEILSCAQELITGLDLPDGPVIEFHLSSRFAPGGYAWVFPKGENRANVGVGINPLRSNGKTASEYLDAFIAERCPGGERNRFVIGGCSVARGLPTLAADGFVAVGEAAHQNNPFSGGGIINALEGADMAAEAILTALSTGDTSARTLDSYSRRWNRSVGKTNEAFYLAAHVFFNLSDNDMDRVIHRATRIPGVLDDKGIKPVRMTLGIVIAHPLLLFKVLRLALSRKMRRVG